MDEYKSSDNNKLYFLSNITENFGLQKYLDLGLPQSKTKHINKGSYLSLHHLQIERGRYTRPKTLRENRLCNNCNIVEDEVHFLFICAKNELARVHLPNIIPKSYKVIVVQSLYFSRLLNQYLIQYQEKMVRNWLNSSASKVKR